METAELRLLLEAASPRPWNACKDGECTCGQIWTESGDHPVADVTRGVWGDTYPALRAIESPTSGMSGTAVEAYLERIEYGEVGPTIAAANAKLIVALVNEIEPLLNEVEMLRKKVVSLEIDRGVAGDDGMGNWVEP